MSRTTDGKIWGLLTLLLLVVPAILMIPTGSMGLSTVTLKVTVVDEVKEPITDASVSAVNVHSGVVTALYYDASAGYYSANVMPGTYSVTAVAGDYGTGSIVVKKISEDNQDSVNPITLTTMDNSARLNLMVEFDGEALSGATAHIFAGGYQKTSVSAENGWANFTGPHGLVHLLVFSEGKVTYSTHIDLNSSSPTTITVGLAQKPSGRAGTYRILGDVKGDGNNLPGISVHVWDVANAHMVPIDGTYDGAISVPLYASEFRLLIEADGYEPMLVGPITLDSEVTYYTPEGETFQMTSVATPETRTTTIDMSGTDGVKAPMLNTVWTLDANSKVYGFDNAFGTPRMQISGPFYSSDWLTAEISEADAVEVALLSYGPAWAVTDDFLKVNGKAYEASGEFTVEATGFDGDATEKGVNPVVTMGQGYTSDIAFASGANLRVEVLTVLPGENILIKIPTNYEVLGEFGDKAEFPYQNSTSMILVKEALEFNAKKVKAPVAEISFSNAYEHYRVADKNYTVALNKNVTLSGQSSSDMVGKIAEYTWTIPSTMKYKVIKGNLTGTADVEADKVTLQFTENMAAYGKIDLVVKDSSGLVSKPASIWIKADGAVPQLPENKFTVKIVGKTAYLDWPVAVDEDVELEFNASAATDNGNITNYVWTFGDKTAPLNGKVVKHRFADPGTYNLSLKVVDSVKNELKLVNVTYATINDITKPAPVINPFSGEPKMGTFVTLNATQSYDPRTNGNIETLANYSWSWFDKAEKKNVTYYGIIVKHNFTVPGEYTFNLTVADAAGLKAWITRTLMINGPDLEVRNVEFRDPSINKITEGKKVKFSIPIVNNGDVKASGGWKIRVELDGKKVKEATISAVIDPKETYYYNETFTPEIYGRDKELKVIVDVDDDIAEEIETANEYKTKIDIKEAPPLIQWWWFFIALAVLLVVYVIFMKVTRNEWGYEVVQKWWASRKRKE